MSADAEQVKPKPPRKTLILLALACVLVFALDPVIDTHPHFKVEQTFSFYGWYAFASVFALMAASRLLQLFVHRKEDYYNE